MKNLINLLFVTLLCGSIPATTVHAGEETAAEQAGWRLGVQAYTFRAITFMETVDKVQALGLKYIEMYPGQKLKPGSNVKTGPDMSESDVAEVQARLKAAGVRIIAFGVAALPTNAAAARLRFEWAKKMGIEVLVTETTPNAMLDQLSGEFGIKIALHNHPKTWPPEKVLEATKSLSKRIGSCSDTGHWKRAGLDPVATLKQLAASCTCISRTLFPWVRRRTNGRTPRGAPADATRPECSPNSNARDTRAISSSNTSTARWTS
jgi:hypothetical protein